MVCQTHASAVLANLALSRIRLHKNKRVEQGKSLTREVLSLLLAEKDDQARIRVREAERSIFSFFLYDVLMVSSLRV